MIGTGPEGGGGNDAAERLRNLAGGVAYAAFFAVAVRVLTGSGGSGSSQPRHATAGVLGWPGGRWLVGLAGAILIIVCLVQAYEALDGDFLDDNKTEQMSGRQRQLVRVLSAASG